MRQAACLLILAPALALADDVYMRGAGVLSGRIVEQTDEMIQVDIGDGIIGVPAANVERIVTGQSPLDEYDARAAKRGPNDAGGWRSLGRWASQKGLSKQARQAYEQVLVAAPDNAEARQALGYVRLDGRWMTEEESYRARGYVQYEGEWMTPAEAQQAQTHAAAEAARREAEYRAIEAQNQAAAAEQRAREAEERAEKAEEDARRAAGPTGSAPSRP